MNNNVDTSQNLENDVIQLRERFSDTQALYREVAALLFFRYGITPTANRLYQLVRKGSMSAPARALQDFWQDLREKSRVRLDHADIPEGLSNKVGDLISQLWLEALAESKDTYQSFYDDCSVEVSAAQTSLAQAKLALEEKDQALTHTTAALLHSEKQGQQLKDKLLVSQHELTNSTERNNVLIEEKQALTMALQKQHDQFTSNLEKLQSGISLTEERARASERIALMEIEKERGLRSSAEKALATAQDQHQHDMAQHQTALNALQEETAVLRHQLQQLSLQQHQADSFNAETQAQLTQALKKLTESHTRLAVFEEKNQYLIEQRDELKRQLELALENRRVTLKRRHLRH